MQICTVCGKKFIRKDYFERHTHEPVAEPVVESVPEPAIETQVSVVSEPVPVADPTIKLRFRKYVEIRINGTPYVGKEIIVKDMNVASEIVRIAREAYGSDILEGV